MYISIVEAKAKFSQVIRNAELGESVTITRYGEPVAILQAEKNCSHVLKAGSMKGKIEIADDFDELPMEFMLAFQSEQKSK